MEKVRCFHPFRRFASKAPRALLLCCGLILFGFIHPSAAEPADASLIPSIFSAESAPARAIHELSLFVLAITGGIFLLVAGLLTYVIIRYRRRADDDGTEPPQVYGSNPVEVAWTVVPGLIVVVLVLSTARVIHEIQDAPPSEGALEVQVTGHQWWWEIRYPGLGVVTANELHVPVSTGGKRTPTFIELRSADVIHSFWVPRLNGKTDLIPGRINRMWIEPERTGLFIGQCAEYCGTQHAKMLLRVYVHSRDDFDRWVAGQKELARGGSGPAIPNGPDGVTQVASVAKVAAGKLVFERTACINCHTVGGTVSDGRFGPDLTHLMSRETIGSGALPNTPENLRAWIKNPHDSKPGVLMPAMNLSDRELDEVVAYLSTLH